MKKFFRSIFNFVVAAFIIAQISYAAAADFETETAVARKIAAPYYDKAKLKARQFTVLRTFGDHGENHALTVAIKSQQAADAISKVDDGNPYYSTIDKLELQIAAILHDTGMDGGIFKDYSDGNALRKDHSLNSAIHVLENRTEIAALGVNPDKIALDCMGHSKSCSGVRNLTSHEQWTDCFNRIDAAVEMYNAKFPDRKIYFDKSTWTNGETYQKASEKNPKQIVEIYRFNRETLAQSAALIAALRIGDANREESEFPYTQSGELIEVDFDSYVPNAKDWKAEVQKAKIFVIDDDGKRISFLTPGIDNEGYERMYRSGEGNLSMDCAYNPKTQALREILKVHNGKSFPLSTQSCIEDRLEELDSMKHLPVEANIQIAGNFSAKDKKRIARTYERYCKNAQRQHQFAVTFEFVEK